MSYLMAIDDIYGSTVIIKESLNLKKNTPKTLIDWNNVTIK